MATASDLPTVTGEFEVEQDGFYADLADCLHAMAQPLTILRSAIAMLSLANESEAPRHRCLDISSRQVDRVCNLFASLQTLVASRLESACSAPTDLKALLSQTVEDQTPAFRERGVDLATAQMDPLPPALGDVQRTEQAISAALEVALSASSQGDRIEIRANRVGRFIEVIVAGEQCRSLNSGELVNLSVVKANILSQRGQYRLSAEPFCVTLALPVWEFVSQSEKTPPAAYAN